MNKHIPARPPVKHYEPPKLLSLQPLRCANFPCRSLRAPGDPLYCAKCREEITAEAWLAIQTQEAP